MTRNSASTLTFLALGTWFAAAVAAGLSGAVNDPGRPPLALIAFVALPILGFVTAYSASASLRAFADGISWPLLVGAHGWRFVGLGFVIAWLVGDLPAAFAIPAGLGDVAAAAGALLLLRKLRAGSRPRGWLLAWNVLGLIDLLLALTLGLLYSNSIVGVLGPGTVTTQLMVTFPVNLIPMFFVPLFLLLHLLTFRKIAGLSGAAGVRRQHFGDAQRELVGGR
jgi:hypothetical protein